MNKAEWIEDGMALMLILIGIMIGVFLTCWYMLRQMRRDRLESLRQWRRDQEELEWPRRNEPKG